MIAGVATITALSAHGEYKLKISKGKFPEDVKVENINGNIPQSTAYKRGWTDQGWTVGDCGKRMNVALCPSYLKEGEVCENSLTLPLMTIAPGEWLSWEGCAAYPRYKEAYTVEYRQSGSDIWNVIDEYSETDNKWNLHLADLSCCYGKEVELRLVCRSSNGYMLALSNVAISTPEEPSVECVNRTPKFFSLSELNEGSVNAEFSIMNSGAPISGAIVSILSGEEIMSSYTEEGEWATGETRFFSLPLPLSKNVRTDYEITVESEGRERQTVSESFAYCTSFKRRLLVDKGTGMWCNACPSGTLAMEQLEEEYGDAIIGVETHNGDPLANEVNFTWLRFYSIPRMLLNRTRASIGDGIEQFGNYICLPTDMEVTIDGLVLNDDNTLTAKATVRTSEDFTSTDNTFRIGYVVTKNFEGNENPEFYQKNVYTISSYFQYYFLPSKIPADLCFFPNVSLTSPLATASENIAFSGIPGSLPEKLEAESSYECKWDIPLPIGYDDFSGMRVVAYILDADNANVINSTTINTADATGVEWVEADMNINGNKTIYSIDGRKITGTPEPGIYIVGGKKRMVN